MNGILLGQILIALAAWGVWIFFKTPAGKRWMDGKPNSSPNNQNDEAKTFNPNQNYSLVTPNTVKMKNQNASKIKFMECRMSGQESKFIMQMEHPQCLFQVLEFNDMEQYKAFAKKNDETEMPYTQVGSRMMALRLSCCIQFVEIRQDNANDIYKQVTAIELEAAKWYNEFLNQK